MTEPQMGLRYQCLEAGCGRTIDAGSEGELVELVTAHMSDAHDSFELEDVIIDNAVPIPAEDRVEAAD